VRVYKPGFPKALDKHRNVPVELRSNQKLPTSSFCWSILSNVGVYLKYAALLSAWFSDTSYGFRPRSNSQLRARRPIASVH
jgi:hypothetical protein